MTALFTNATTWILAASESGEAAKLSDGGVLASWAWLIPVVPMVAAFAIVFWGKKMPYKGWDIAIAVMAFEALYGTALLLSHISSPIAHDFQVEIAKIGNMPIEWGWTVDGLSIMMYFVVGVVGFLVFAYAKGYMEGDIRFTWFFASFTLFAGGMLVLVSSPNFIQLIVGWELVGVASWLLIGHYWEEHENSSAAIKAFLTNKVADVGLFVGAIIVSMSVGSFRFSDVLHAVEGGAAEAPMLAQFAFWGGLALFIGAMGKSAQFPLHVWLPDAMAGPTPVSALMHAATMVTAGIYLVARMFPLYLTDGFATEVRAVIIIIGGLTLFLTGLIALVQDDIKKVLAYSTLSQLGYMMAAMGAGAYTAGLFHLFTHAFFKALLFLGAGSVIHSVHSNNMSDMGGLRKDMPWTYRTFVIGSLALAGIVPLAGFFSKDEILASLRYASGEFGVADGGGGLAAAILALAIVGAFITAFYMARTVFLTFHGEYKGHGHPHESPKIMWVPLAILAGFSVVAGWINIPGITEVFTKLVGGREVKVLDHHATSFDIPMLVAGLVAAGLGIYLGWRIWGPDEETQQERDTFKINGLYPVLENKYYIDDFYMDGVIRPIRGPVARAMDWFNGHVLDFFVNGAGLLAKAAGRVVYWFDQRGVDGAINASGAITGAGGGVLRLLQTGKVQQYAVLIFAATVILVGGLVIWF
ncbi:MAG: NADH-quinone oxidoreductase subunit L [Acidimicrobiia bacterium]|nr:NADH-quinone oxidoreductase subunit L [Acidimicrobiia bacterium]